MDQSWTIHLIIEKVTEVLVDALEINKYDVTLTSRITEDLMATDTDYTDIAMRSVRKFSLKMEADVLKPLISKSHAKVEDLCKEIAERLNVQWIAQETVIA